MQCKVRNWHRRNTRAARVEPASVTVGGGPGVAHGEPYVQLHVHKLEGGGLGPRLDVTITDAAAARAFLASVRGAVLRAFGEEVDRG